MTYATLMVHLEIGRSNESLLNISAVLADRFKAAVVGIAVGQQLQPAYVDGYAAGDMFALDLDDINKNISEAEDEFRKALASASTRLEWRSSVQMGPQAEHIATEARSADIVLTGARGPDLFGTSRMASCAEIVMRAGRPVLVVPDAVNVPRLDWIVVGWKDTREARRAVSDALPFLSKAAHVTVVEFAMPDDMDSARSRVDDVCAWLAHHGISAEAVVQSAGDGDNLLDTFAERRGADLIVAGAYGHTRLGEWLFGGYTKDLVRRARRCVLLSH
ncbi:universal stress protein [Acidovorax sp. A1169]|uniref:universal stress protein n=1 Tax=Acidovorax sp. A1169 TaxID=3059524 RepID=UPI002737B72C|nr:universal stress protein [Acidovorax sp. A1169]MDP4076356.1 universal stress protein [Acidovorax sp. A1169]